PRSASSRPRLIHLMKFLAHRLELIHHVPRRSKYHHRCDSVLYLDLLTTSPEPFGSGSGDVMMTPPPTEVDVKASVVVVQIGLVRMRPEPDRIELFLRCANGTSKLGVSPALRLVDRAAAQGAA